MLEMLSHGFMQRALLASVLGGTACGIVGTWVVLLRIPFVGVAMSHAAFAGAVVGLLAGVNPLLTACGFSVLSAVLVGPIADRGELSPNVSIGILFSIVLGIAFLALGFIEGPKTEALQLLWGSILTITNGDLALLALTVAVTLGFLAVLYKELKAIMYNREIAKALGIPEVAIFYALLGLTGVVVTANLETIGGLLIFSLVVSPAAAAYQLTYRMGMLYLLSVLFAVSSCLLGVVGSYFLNAPSGASIIIASSAIFGICLWLSPKRRRVRV
jgi:manganese/iron transport system permease protein